MMAKPDWDGFMYEEAADGTGQKTRATDPREEQARARQLEAILAMSREIARETRPDAILRIAVRQLRQVMDCESAVVHLTAGPPRETAAEGPVADHPGWRMFVESLAGRVARSGVRLVSGERSLVSPSNGDGADLPECIHSLVALPLRNYEKEVIGLIAVFNQRGRAFNNADVEVLKILAGLIGQQMENAQLYAQVQDTFCRFAKSLSSAVDGRDLATAGHSLRVGDYSMRIAERMRLPVEDRERIYMAALLHDIGKIGVPDHILRKPGPLTLTEMRIVQRHVEVTEVLLSRMSFPPGFEDVPLIACQHHEKYDGTGYPHGLQGGEIDRRSRILAVADVFDALTSDRHYRAPMGRTEATALLLSKSGSWFDPDVVEAFGRIAHSLDHVAERLSDEEADASRMPILIQREGWSSDG